MTRSSKRDHRRQAIPNVRIVLNCAGRGTRESTTQYFRDTRPAPLSYGPFYWDTLANFPWLKRADVHVTVDQLKNPNYRLNKDRRIFSIRNFVNVICNAILNV